MTRTSQPDVGCMHSEIRDKRIIDRWTFTSPISSESNPPIRVAVTLHNRREGPVFSAWSTAFGDEDALENSDLARLKEAVRARCQAICSVRDGRAWEDWIEIETSDYVYGKDGAALSISYRILKRAVADDGRVLLMGTHSVTDFPSPKAADEEDPDVDESLPWAQRRSAREKSHQYSYIKATPENLAAVQSVCERLKELRVRLNELLAQDNVQQALSSVWSDLPRLESK